MPSIFDWFDSSGDVRDLVSRGYKFWLPNGQKYFGACRPTALAGFYHAERFQPDWKPRQRIWKREDHNFAASSLSKRIAADC